MAIGDLFKKVAGKDPADCIDLLDIERKAEEVLGKNLAIKPFESDLVPKRGNVFEVAAYEGDLDKNLDEANERIREICHP